MKVMTDRLSTINRDKINHLFLVITHSSRKPAVLDKKGDVEGGSPGSLPHIQGRKRP
jgi:hypothetical protein